MEIFLIKLSNGNFLKNLKLRESTTNDESRND